MGRRRRIGVVALALVVMAGVAWWASGSAGVEAPKEPPARRADPVVDADEVVTAAVGGRDAGAIPGSDLCEIYDGVPPRPDVDDRIIQIKSGRPGGGALHVWWQVRAEGVVGFDDAGAPILELADWANHRKGRITAERLTLRHCRVPGGAQIDLDDGRVGIASLSRDGGDVRLTPVAPTRVRGRIVRDGGVIENAMVFLGDESASSRADGRFSFELFPEGEVTATLRAEGGLPDYRWGLARELKPIHLGPGMNLDLGDIEMERLPPISPGKVGIAWNSGEGESIVAAVVEDTPAERAGIRPGDQVVEVDGVAVQTIPEAMRLIPGAAGTHVRLKILRGTDYLLFDIVRQR